jgi:hypothetical protein
MSKKKFHYFKKSLSKNKIFDFLKIKETYK